MSKIEKLVWLILAMSLASSTVMAVDVFPLPEPSTLALFAVVVGSLSVAKKMLR